jgi:hypothetical protein
MSDNVFILTYLMNVNLATRHLFIGWWLCVFLSLCGAGQPVAAQSLLFKTDTVARTITLRNSETTLTTGSFTLEAWVYSPAWKNLRAASPIFYTHFYDELKVSETVNGFVLAIGEGKGQKNGSFNVTLQNEGQFVKLRTPPLITTNQWQHVALVVADKRITLYIDGQNMGQTDMARAYIPSQVPIRMGIGYDPAQNTVGAMDEIRVWNTARTEAQIQQNRTRTLTGSEPGLVAYFPIDKTAGNVLKNKAKSPIVAEYASADGLTFWDDHASNDDVGIEQIAGPDVFMARQGPARIELHIKNNGTKPILRLPLRYDVNEKTVLRDTVQTTIAPGQHYRHKTAVPVFGLATGTARLTVRAMLPGDSHPKNDTISTVYRPVVSMPGRQTALLCDSLNHNYWPGQSGNYHFFRATLPLDNHRYSRILLHIALACPPGGCDVWDRVGQLFVFNNGHQLEIARFVTPYGVPCGPWTIDVTDFKSILTGPCLFQSLIEGWTERGFLLTTWLEFVENGPNPLPYQRVTALWQNDYFVYGDDRYLQQLPVLTHQLHPRTRSITFRQTITGHGEGNTDNASEYAKKTHLMVFKQPGQADSLALKHVVWRDDCAKNPCNTQLGSYFYSRAGWCPGQDVRPWRVGLGIPKLTAEVRKGLVLKPGQPITLDYRIQPYRNLARRLTYPPGQSESYLRMQSYLVEQSDSSLTDAPYRNLACQTVAVAADGQVSAMVLNTGTEPMMLQKLRCFADQKLWAAETLPVALQLNPGKSETIRLKKRIPLDAMLKTVSVLADADADDNSSDDSATVEFTNTLTPKK